MKKMTLLALSRKASGRPNGSQEKKSRYFWSRVSWAAVAVVVLWWVTVSSANAQSQYIGYVYPAGGQQGTTFTIRLGGQRLLFPTAVVISGEGVTARLVAYYPNRSNQELGLLRQQLRELQKKETRLSEAMIKKMASWTFPKPIGPPELLKAEAAKKKTPSKPDAKFDNEAAKQRLIERIKRIFAEDQRVPAVRAHCEIIYAEVTIAPNAKPGRREIRVVTKRGISNPLPFYVGQVPEVARKPMKTSRRQILGKEYLSLRKRPPEEEEIRITLPHTMNGQIASGEINRYRFYARKGQRLVISVKARALVPYIADAVPGWFQPVLKLCDAQGHELAYVDDFRFNPDPVLYFVVPKDGEYVLSITDALFRGREYFVYRITIGELPFVTDIFPLGGRLGRKWKIQMKGWNLQNARLQLPPSNTSPGIYKVTAKKGKYISNPVLFAVNTLPEIFEKEPNNRPEQAQKVKLPVIVNGRVNKPGDWDVFEVEGKAGQTVVVEVLARRLGSPLDSFIKVTTPDHKIIALNDDHLDAASGLVTSHTDSYLMFKLPKDGKYFIHLGETTQHGGPEYAYRLRISPPRPDFQLRVVPSRAIMRSKSGISLTVYAIRRDGFNGQILLQFENVPEGFKPARAVIKPNQNSTRIYIRTTLKETPNPLKLTLVGTTTVNGRKIVHKAVPAEDRMQAFLWRQLVPADELLALVYDPTYKPPALRKRPPIREEDRPKNVKPRYTKRQVQWRLRQIENLYQQWLLTDEFANRLIARIEAETFKEEPKKEQPKKKTAAKPTKTTKKPTKKAAPKPAKKTTKKPTKKSVKKPVTSQKKPATKNKKAAKPASTQKQKPKQTHSPKQSTPQKNKKTGRTATSQKSKAGNQKQKTPRKAATTNKNKKK